METEKSIIFKIGDAIYIDDLREAGNNSSGYTTQKYLGDINYIGKNFFITEYGYEIHTEKRNENEV